MKHKKMVRIMYSLIIIYAYLISTPLRIKRILRDH